MYPKHKEAKRNKKQSQEYRLAETLARKPALQSSIPPRASARPSALAAVRSKYPRRFTDLEQVAYLDVTRVPTLPQKAAAGPSLADLTGSGISPRRTEDLPTGHIFSNLEGLVTPDEIDTFPPDVQAQLHPKLHRSTDELLPLSDLHTLPALPVSSFQGRPEEVPAPVKTGSWAVTPLPTSVESPVQPQEFSTTWHVLDSVRWWLITPGRLEFLLCLIGALVLICVTSFFVVMIMISLGLLRPRV